MKTGYISDEKSSQITQPEPRDDQLFRKSQIYDA